MASSTPRPPERIPGRSPESGPLTHRLCSSVRYQPLVDGRVALIRLFPLKAVILPAAWHPLVEALARGEVLSWSAIESLSPRQSRSSLERFLNSLVLKGLLMPEGVMDLPPDQWPTVSIVIPVRNRPGDLADCLTSLAQLDYPRAKLDIIVVDDA